MYFAARTDFGGEDTARAEALRTARLHPDFIDLTITNPTRAGLPQPLELLAPLSDPSVLQYEADPMGMHSAREAISNLYRNTYNASVRPDQILLTASTSEAYSYLLRLFCEPGDQILVPSPSYPLFDLLARLHDVELITYPLVYHDGWQIDPASLQAAITSRTRAIVAIHPNNPTGHYCSANDRETLFDTAKQHNLPLIVDEVFLDYTVEGPAQPSFAALNPSVLTFVLGGLSKLLALPQMKLAGTVVCGPAAQQTEAMERLEVIADTFLSIATPPQIALPAWLTLQNTIQQPIRERIQTNLRTLDQALQDSPVSRLKLEGGWAAILRIPAHESDHEAALRLLAEHHLSVHPGSFYNLPKQGWLVLSLLGPNAQFEQGVNRLIGSFR